MVYHHFLHKKTLIFWAIPPLLDDIHFCWGPNDSTSASFAMVKPRGGGPRIAVAHFLEPAWQAAAVHLGAQWGAVDVRIC